MENILRQITIKTKFEGIHCYPEAPDEVAFLRNPHRHEFYVEAIIEVFSDDRDLEFIIVKRSIDNFIKEEILKEGPDLGRASCEMLADKILSFLKRSYKYRKITVAVLEDNENGSLVVSI